MLLDSSLLSKLVSGPAFAFRCVTSSRRDNVLGIVVDTALGRRPAKGLENVAIISENVQYNLRYWNVYGI